MIAKVPEVKWIYVNPAQYTSGLVDPPSKVLVPRLPHYRLTISVGTSLNPERDGEIDFRGVIFWAHGAAWLNTSD